ncbi:protein FAM217B isoform X2 [Triplophysa dalaica]|uniref:protein FAM217B isoform X2 n=1 Tax=Triplophysa dalaica TaxID=1582913 RepID=UPI0024DF8293|nr:protein FAM217B isoform X2 [Triplophysa dalaica]
MPVMGAVLQERTLHNAHNEFRSLHRTETNRFGPSKRNTKTSLHQPHNSGNSLSAEPDCQQRLRQTRPEKKSIVADSPVRQNNTKIKSHVSSKNGLKESRPNQSSNAKKVSGSKSSGPQPVQQISVKEQREESSECRSEAKDTAVCKNEEEDSDSASDLSDSERCSTLPPQIVPPDLDLRAEVIDPSDLHPSRLACRGRTAGSYPDFLPPPFNSWSLKQLAVYLNTDGKGISRPKPVGQLERYLDRLLQMEWHQIQTVQEESSKCNGPTPKGRHTSSHSSLSSPKCILQCQRAFPLALLSSLTNTPTMQLPSCPDCRKRYPISHAYQHRHTRLSPKRGQASGFPKRSCSESRAHQFNQRQKTREHRLSDPLSESSHLKRMQAVGNIRNPVGAINNSEQISAITPSTPSLNDVKIKRSGRRSHSCGGMREAGYKTRARSEQRKTFDETKQDSDLSGARSSDGLLSSKDSVTGLNRKQKRVEFVTN